MLTPVRFVVEGDPERFERGTGGRAHLRMSLALHSLRTVTDPPRPASGRLVAAGSAHRPTCNRIYAAVGYRRFGDWEEHEFAGPAG